MRIRWERTYEELFISKSNVLLLFVSRVVVDPLDVLTVLPDADLTSSINLDESTTAMLLAVEPLTLVDSAILPFEDTVSLALVTDKLTFILLSVGPLEDSLAIHFVLVPVTFIGLAVGPNILANT